MGCGPQPGLSARGRGWQRSWGSASIAPHSDCGLRATRVTSIISECGQWPQGHGTLLGVRTHSLSPLRALTGVGRAPGGFHKDLISLL